MRTRHPRGLLWALSISLALSTGLSLAAGKDEPTTTVAKTGFTILDVTRHGITAFEANVYEERVEAVLLRRDDSLAATLEIRTVPQRGTELTLDYQGRVVDIFLNNADSLFEFATNWGDAAVWDMVADPDGEEFELQRFRDRNEEILKLALGAYTAISELGGSIEDVVRQEFVVLESEGGLRTPQCDYGSQVRGVAIGSMSRSNCCARAQADANSQCNNSACYGCCELASCDACCFLGDYLCSHCGMSGWRCAIGTGTGTGSGGCATCGGGNTGGSSSGGGGSGSSGCSCSGSSCGSGTSGGSRSASADFAPASGDNPGGVLALLLLVGAVGTATVSLVPAARGRRKGTDSTT